MATNPETGAEPVGPAVPVEKSRSQSLKISSDVDDQQTPVSEYGIEIAYLPPDQRPGLTAELLAQLVDPEIDDDSEAAEALRANANVEVTRMGKVMRSVHAQSVRRVLKRATLKGQSGIKRGKPPRIPPGMIAAGHNAYQTGDGDDKLYSVSEEVEPTMEEGEGHQDSGSLAPAGTSSDRGDGQESPSQQGHLSGPSLCHDQLNGVEHGGVKDEVSTSSPKPDEDWKNKKDVRDLHFEDAKDIPHDVAHATLEAGKKLMGVMDPHNILAMTRWRRKRRKDGKKKRKSYVKGKVIDGRHELYTLSIAMMLGLRTSIARTHTVISSENKRKALTACDFMAEQKYEFSPKGSAITPPHKLSHTFKFKDYSPLAFAYLRRMFGINEFDFLLSVCGNANFIEFISNAKSQQFFFYSSDGKYMIKTMTNAESVFLRRILPHYYRHCTQNPNTLVTKFLGMYRVKLYHLRRNVKFVVMNSVYFTDKSLQAFYDLKGSEVGRNAKPGQDVLKDNDLRKQLPEGAIALPAHVRECLRAQIVSDCTFLSKMEIMDYSVLLGIHHVPPKEETHKHGNISETGLKIKHLSQRAHRRDSNQNSPLQRVATDELNIFQHENQGDQDTDDDDDCSYIQGSAEYNAHEKAQNHQKDIDHDLELKKEQTIEQLYWPFHRFYDIHGLRRMHPTPCFKCNTTPCGCNSDLLKAWGIPDFVSPFSTRKDGGLTMDTTGLKLPMTFHGSKGDFEYDGKIFFMGIIDILQQYNARKLVETRYRRVQHMKDQLEPSCVGPDVYAARFVSFFDEYTLRREERTKNKSHADHEKTEVEVSITRGNEKNDVKIDVSDSSAQIAKATTVPIYSA